MIKLRGLTAADRALWDKANSAQLNGLTEEQKDKAWLNHNLAKKYGKGSKKYNEYKQLSLSDRIAKWNSENASLTSKTQTTTDRDIFNKPSRDSIYKNDIIARSDSPARVLDNPELRAKTSVTPKEMQDFQKKSEAYNRSKQQLAAKYDREYKTGREEVRTLKDIANDISPWYKRYKDDPNYITFDDNKWRELTIDYNARKDAYGQLSADAWLKGVMQDEVSSHQSLLSKAWGALTGMGSEIAGASIMAGGLLYGIGKYITGNGNDVPDAHFGQNLLDTMLDNEVTRFGNDVIETGTILPEKMQEMKDLQMRVNPIMRTQQQENPDDFVDLVFNQNTIFDLVDQYGFTVASMGIGGAMGKGTQALFNFKKAATIAKNAERTAKAMEETSKALGRLKNIENGIHRYAIPGLVGTTEGAVEGLNTKLQMLEDGEQMLAEQQSAAVDKKFEDLMASQFNARFQEAMQNNKPTRMADGRILPPETPEQIAQRIQDELYQEAWDSYEDTFKDAKERLLHDASTAGIINFQLNSILNGAMNQTLKATMFHPATKNALRSSRLGKLFKVSPNPEFKIIDGVIKQNKDIPLIKKIWAYSEEPLGNMFEEGFQDVSDEASRAGARNDLKYYLDVKYNGAATKSWWNQLADDFGAAAEQAGVALRDRNTYKDALFGAMSSVVGGLALPRMTTAVDENGKPIVETDDNGNKKVKRTLFGRGLNDAGKVESNLERIARLMPWRSGALQARRELQRASADKEQMEQTLNAWFQKPENQKKFDGLTGSFNWGSLMQNFAEENDEFGFRNSTMGKAINDALMLRHLKGTEFYDSIIQTLEATANAEEGSDLANDIVAKLRNDATTRDAIENSTDTEALNEAKKNAQRILDVIKQTEEHVESLERQFGDNIDDDTLEALVYHHLMGQDNKDRQDKLETEIAESFGKAYSTTNGTSKKQQNSGANDNTKRAVAAFGSIKKASENKEKLQQEISDLIEKKKKLQQDKDDIDKDRNKGRKERRKEKQDKDHKVSAIDATLDKKRAQLKQLNELLGDADISEEVTLSEDEIMSLSPSERARMLNPKNISSYTEKQQKVIRKLTNKLKNEDKDILTKIADIARLDKNRQSSAELYNIVAASPQAYRELANAAKYEAKKDLYKSKYDNIKDIEDYEEFAQEMDKMLVEATEDEKRVILNQLNRDEEKREEGLIEEDSNFKRYRDSRNELARLLDSFAYTKRFQKMSSNEIGMLTHAVSYLTSKGIELDNYDAVLNALTEQDEDDNNNFEKYVNRLNDVAEDNLKVEFTDPTGVYTNLKEIIDSITKNTENYDRVHAPIQPAPTSPDSNISPASPTPPVQDNPNPGEVEEPIKPTEKNPTNPIIESFRDKNGDNIVADVQYLINAINNSSLSKDDKDKALDALRALTGDKFNTSKDLLDAFKEQLKSETANIQDVVGNLISNRLAWVQAEESSRARREEMRRNRERDLQEQAQEEKRKAQSKNQLYQKALREIPSTSPLNNPNNNVITTIDIQSIRAIAEGNVEDIAPEMVEYAKILRDYLDTYGVEEFLRKQDWEIENGNVKVFYAYDAGLTSSVASTIPEYNKDNDTPIVALVKSKDGPIKIGDESYQPIGILPSGGTRISGSRRANMVREALYKKESNPEGLFLIQSKDSNTPLSSILKANPIKADNPKHLSTNTKTVFDAALESHPNSRERDLVRSMPKKGTGRNSIKKLRNAKGAQGNAYRAIRNRFLGRLKKTQVKRINPLTHQEESREAIVVEMDALYPGKRYDEEVYVTEVENTIDVNTGINFLDLVRGAESNPSYKEQALHSNTKVTRFFNTLDKVTDYISKYMQSSDLEERRTAISLLNQALNGEISKEAYEGMSDSNFTSMLKSIGIYRHLLPKTRNGYKYEAVADYNADGTANVELYITKDNLRENRIFLGTLRGKGEIPGNPLTNHTLTRDEEFDILKNMLLFSDDGEYDGVEHSKGQYRNIIRWNIDYSDVEKMRNGGEDANDAKERLEQIFDDGLLRMSKNAAEYQVRTVAIESPFDTNGNQADYSRVKGNFRKTTVVNSDNAAPVRTTRSNARVEISTPAGVTIDGDTGRPIDGGTTITPEQQSKKDACAAKVEELQEEYRQRVSRDETHETDESGKTYISVTTLITTDKESPYYVSPSESNNDNSSNIFSNVVNPATEIGTGMDEFIRDFIEGKKIKYNPTARQWYMESGEELSEVYPNASQRTLSTIAEGISIWKNNMETQYGLTFVTRDLGIRGSVEVLDDEGSKHTVNLSGVLDLLAYDNDGNWYLYDIKTFNGQNPDSETQREWALQLSLYKELLAQKGIFVKEMGILPISLRYDARAQFTKSLEDTHKDYPGSQNNQLLVNGQKFSVTSGNVRLPQSRNLKDAILKMETRPLNAMASRIEELLRSKDASVNQDGQSNSFNGRVVAVAGFDRANIDTIINPDGTINFGALQTITSQYFSSENIPENLETRKEHHEGETNTLEHLQHVVDSARRLGIQGDLLKHLVLAAALHDVAKPLHGGIKHGLQSAEIIDKIFDGNISELTKFAIRNHMMTLTEGTEFTLEDAQRIVQEAQSLNLDVNDSISILLALNMADIIRGRDLQSIDELTNKPLYQVIESEISNKLNLFEQASGISIGNEQTGRPEDDIFGDGGLQLGDSSTDDLLASLQQDFGEVSDSTSQLAFQYTERELRWENLSEEFKRQLESEGKNELSWNQLPNMIKQCRKDCFGR